MRTVLRRLEHEAALWREEPIRRVEVRNRLLRPVRRRQFGSFGALSFIDRPAWLYGTEHISVGDLVIILRGAWLSVERMAWESTEPVIQIGDRVAARTGCTMSAAESIVIENDVGMAGNVTIVDSKHTWHPGDLNVLHAPVKSAPIRVGAGTWLADRATVAAGADIGVQCAIGPNTVVSSTVADYSIVIGNPGRVVGSTRT